MGDMLPWDVAAKQSSGRELRPRAAQFTSQGETVRVELAMKLAVAPE